MIIKSDLVGWFCINNHDVDNKVVLSVIIILESKKLVEQMDAPQNAPLSIKDM